MVARNSRRRGLVCQLRKRGLLGRVRNRAEMGLHEHLERRWSGSPLGGCDRGGRLSLVHGGSMRVNRELVNRGRV